MLFILCPLSPGAKIKPPDSRLRADKDVAILWIGKNTTQWSPTAAATHAAAVCKVEAELSADFAHEHAHQHAHKQKLVYLNTERGKVKRRAGRGVNERENTLSIKEYVSLILIISW